MTYSVRANRLQTTLGKFHIFTIGEEWTEKAERLAQLHSQVFDAETDAASTLARLEYQADLMRERMSQWAAERGQ